MATFRSSWVCARFDCFEVDLSSGDLRKLNGVSIRIQPKPLRVLRLLLEAEGRVVSREQLRAALWPEETFVDSEHGVNTAVKKLRQALDDSVENPKFIETLPKVGYRFKAHVEWVSDTGNNRAEQSMPALHEEATVPGPNRSGRWKPKFALALGALLAVIATSVLFADKLGYLSRSRLGIFLSRIRIWDRPTTQRNVTERRLTANPDDTPVTSGVISPDGKVLAYTDSTGFYLRQVDSGETHLMPLPTGFDSAIVESWFPDGIHLVLSGAQSPQTPPSLWKVSAIGGTARKLTNEGSSASVSPEGDHIVFLKQAGVEQEVWLMEADGDKPRKLLSSHEDNFSRLAWAPDGNRFAFAKTKTRYYTSRSAPDTTIEVFDLLANKTTVIRLLGERGLPRGGAALGWLPEGRLIYPVREPRPNQQDTNLWSVPIDPTSVQTRGEAVRLTAGRGIAVQLSLSSDGKRIALRRHAPQPDIYIADLEQNGKELSAPKRLTLDDRLDYATSWTSDSRAVVFHSNRDGPFHIFKQNIDATQPELLVGGEDDLYMPRSSPDGSSVLYVVRAKPGGASDNARVMRVLHGGGPPQFVLEDSGIWDVQCARLPSTLCVYSKIEAAKQTFFTFDPLKGKPAELQVAETGEDNFDWCLSPDGKYIAWARNRVPLEQFGVRILSLSNGSKRDVAVPEWIEIYGLDWAADSKSLWATAYNTKGTRALLNLGLNGKIRTILYRNVDLEWAIPSPDGRRLAIVQDANTSNVWLLENF